MRSTKSQNTTLAQTFAYYGNVVLLEIPNSAMNVFRRRSACTRTEVATFEQNCFESSRCSFTGNRDARDSAANDDEIKLLFSLDH